MSNAAKKTPVTALSIPERAVAALGYNAETRKELTTLAAGSAHITEITNDDGYKQVHAARMVLVNTRLNITRRGKEARDDATKFGKAVISEEQSLIALIEPEEDRLDKLQTDHDAKIEAEKQALVDAEIDRVAGLVARVEAIRRMIDLPANPHPQYVLDTIAEVEAVVVDESFEEYAQQAFDAKIATLSLLHDQQEAAVARIAREEQARKDQEELAELRRLKAERDAADRKREAEAQAGRDEIARVERNRLAAEAQNTGPGGIVVPPVGAPMSDLVHRGPPAQTPGSTDAQLASLQRQADVTPIIVEKLGGSQRTQFVSERPSFGQIVGALCFHFDTDEETVRKWIVDADDSFYELAEAQSRAEVA